MSIATAFVDGAMYPRRRYRDDRGHRGADLHSLNCNATARGSVMLEDQIHGSVKLNCCTLTWDAIVQLLALT